MLNKELIINKCKENGAWLNEFTRLVNSKNDKEFSEVLLNNLEWLKYKNLIQYIDTKELAKYIGNNNKWIYYYCRNIEDRKELWSNLTKNKWIYNYCRYVRDRKELWTRLTKYKWIYKYYKNIKDRPELRIKLKEKNEKDK